MAVTPQREPGQHALEGANADRPKFQRGKKVVVRDKRKKVARRRRSRKKK